MQRLILVEIDDVPLPSPAERPVIDINSVPRPPRRSGAVVLTEIRGFTRRQPWHAAAPAEPQRPPLRTAGRPLLADIGGYVFGASPFGSVPFAAGRQGITLDLGDVMIRTGTENFIDADHQEYRHGMRRPSFKRSILTGSAVGGWASTSLGDLELDNLDGHWTNLMNAVAVDGRDVAVKMPNGAGVPETVFACTARDIVPGDDDTVRVRLRDWDYLLDKPAQTQTFPDDALADIANKRLPMAYGPCNNITPVRIKEEPPTYRVNDGASRAIKTIRVGGVPLQPGDVLSRDVAASTFALVAEPIADVTVDIEGAVVNGVYLNTAALIIEDIVFRRLGLPASRKSPAHLAQLAADLPGEMQLYVSHGEEPTGLDLIKRLLVPMGWGCFSWLGKLQVGVWKLASGEPKCLLAPGEGLVSLRRVELPSDINPPPWRVRGGYDRNGTVQSASQLRGDEASPTDPVGGAERRRWLARAQDIAQVKDEVTRDLIHRGAPDPEPWDTCYVHKIDCELVLSAYHAHWLGARAHYHGVLDTPPFYWDIGDVALLQHPDLNGGAPTLGRVAEVDETPDGTEAIFEV
ncbi:hypothetical protein [Azospirillum argentinense]